MFKQRWLSVLFLISLMLCLGLGQVSAQGVTPSMQQGLERYRSGDFQGAIAIWNRALEQPSSEVDRVLLLKSLARVYTQVGQFEPAVAALNSLIAYYQKSGEQVELGRMLTEQAQAYSSLGQQRQAIALLCREQSADEPSECQAGSALAIARQQSDRLGEAAGLGSLGNIYRLQGDYERALRSLQASLALAETLQNAAYVTAAQNGLGNIYASLAKRDYRYAEFAAETTDRAAQARFMQQARESDRQAIQAFETVVQAARQQNNPTQESQALLNLATSSQRSGLQAIEPILQQAYNLRDRLPDSRDKAYGLMRLANLWQQPSQLDATVRCPAQTPSETVTLLQNLLQSAIAVAQRIQDTQAQAFALGRLGHHYECQRNFTSALRLTQQA